MLEKILKSLGLSTKEADVYLAILRTGTAPISNIAKRAGLSRSTAYNILNSLFEKGFVRRFNRASVQHYAPIPPSDLIDLLKKRREEMDNKIEMVKGHMSQFEAICNPSLKLPKISYYEGVEGIKKIYEDMLKKGSKETFAALAMDNMVPELKDWLFNRFSPKKVKKNISSRVIVSSKRPKKFLKLDKKHKRNSLLIPRKKYPFEVEIDVYDDDKTAFISYDETELMGVIIESKKIANTMKSLFSFTWDNLKKK